jgi:hypothetical protein
VEIYIVSAAELLAKEENVLGELIMKLSATGRRSSATRIIPTNCSVFMLIDMLEEPCAVTQ